VRKQKTTRLIRLLLIFIFVLLHGATTGSTAKISTDSVLHVRTMPRSTNGERLTQELPWLPSC
jgi:hypothetical protein